MSREKDIKYWIAISKYSKIGPVRFKKLIKYFKKAKDIWQSKIKELLKAGLENNIAEDFIKKRNQIDPEYEVKKILKEKIKIVTIQDSNYPKLLKKIKNPPFLLYYKGKLDGLKKATLAIIGTRKASPYGKRSAFNIAKKIAENNITIVSGMALGIDTIAHQAALEANMSTIAVLGSGLDQKNIYPSANQNLANKIISTKGALISEYPPGTPAFPYNFPLRNRIISGLSLGTLIIESPEKGGSLITANYAKEQKRKIFAIPGGIYDKNSEGTLKLISSGDAQIITKYEDIIKALDLKKIPLQIKIKNKTPETAEEKELSKYLNLQPIHINELVKLSGLNSEIVCSTLSLMEIKGKIKNLGGMNYVLI
ncbi:MAG: DNA-protecting protein DprA [Xanthomonadaceae bacterium]|nr:DNA-protecting protein DprA [Rhodospirillaceae bacterium]NIA17844.1 DNA-protecting protein DprA [Xanthomonadaceae bacterium]